MADYFFEHDLRDWVELSGCQIDFWTTFLNKIEVLPFTKETSAIAVTISQELKRKRKQISIPDLFIAATAIQNNLAIATLNKKDFDRIENLMLV